MWLKPEEPQLELVQNLSNLLRKRLLTQRITHKPLEKNIALA